MTIETIVNNALDQIGYARHIGSIWEGSLPARVALDLWAQTRDGLLTRLAPDWAKKDATLTLLRSAPNIAGATAEYDLTLWGATNSPPLPWLYEYQTPSDCIKPLQIKSTPLFLPVWRPRAQPFRHTVGSGFETILTNTPNAILTYIVRVQDPDLWQNDFTEVMIQVLGQKMQAEFSKHPVQAQKGQDNADAAG